MAENRKDVNELDGSHKEEEQGYFELTSLLGSTRTMKSL